VEWEKDQFVCQKCGECCRWSGHVLLTDTDISRLAAAANLSETEFIEKYTVLAANRSQLSLADQDDGSCILLDDGLCRFYESRPAQCREFPFSWRVTEGCPGLDALKMNSSASDGGLTSGVV